MNAASERAGRLALLPMENINPPSGLFRGAATDLFDLWQRRQLLWLLIKREIKARYKDSVLGFFWSFARPLMQLLVYYFVIGRFMGAAATIPAYAIFVFTGLTIWSLFSESVTNGTASVISNAGLVKKVRLPREVFPLASIGSAMFNFLVQMSLLLIASLIMRNLHFGGNLLFALGAMVVMIIWSVALALLLSGINVYLRDVQYIVEVVMLLAFWGSPVLYSWTMVAGRVGPLVEAVYLANPVTVCVLAMQYGIYGHPDLGRYPTELVPRLVVCGLVGLVVCFLSQRLFARLQRNFAQEI